MRSARIVRIALCATALVVAASACGGSDREASDNTTAPAATTAAATTTAAPATTGGETTETTAASSATTTGATTTGPAAHANMFGDLAWPCGPGSGANADDGSETGVTATSIEIATGDDAGYAQSPGLNKEITDAIKALAAQCNDLGGINGRQINVHYYDAAILNVAQAMQSACDDGNFFLVGEGWALDSGQEEIRHSCGLPAVPTYTVSSEFAMQPDVFQGVPNPADEIPAGNFAMIGEMFPDKIGKVATLGGNIPANQETIEKYRAVGPDFGWTFVDDRFEYDIFGVVTDWTPYVKQIKDSGATMMMWSGSCLPNLQKFAQTAKQNGLDIPIITDANNYEAGSAAANTDGAMDNVYNRFAFVPFEEADHNKATADYVSLIDAAGGGTSLLGMQATSSFLLWAQAASACGDTLTRQCVLDQLSQIHSWTAGGLHAETDPGGNHPPACNTILKLEGNAYVRVAPTEPATYQCDPSWIKTVSGTPALQALNLDADRHPQTGG